MNGLQKIVYMTRGEKTILTKANTKSDSLRTTLPKGVANQFELKEGDSVYWEIRPSPDGKSLIIVVSPSPEKNKKKK